MAACSTTPSPSPREEGLEIKVDSNAVKVAVMDISAFDSLEYDNITRLHSQWDCDTAFINNRADIVSMDDVRLNYYRRKGMAENWEIIETFTQEWGLYAHAALRVKDVKGLKGKTIATSRETADNQLLMKFVSQAKIKSNEVFFPQINDLGLRLQMLNAAQVDAVMLPEPYASQAEKKHHVCLKKEKIKVYLLKK